jgi:4-hydroxy-tetrahydrodipicolinate synthase
MAPYRKTEARDWAWEHLRGVANVVIPSFSADLHHLNEKGIRHDIRRELELGFAGTLLVSEVAMSIEEYGQFFEWANDESKGRLKLIHHASFNTFDDNILAVRHAERHGGELILLSTRRISGRNRSKTFSITPRRSVTRPISRFCCSR